MKKLAILFSLIAILLLAMSVVSCGSTKKCDGKKATKTNMGNM